MDKEFKAIPGFGKYEINDEGIVRNVKTRRTTEPYHVSNKTGPLVHLIDKKAGKNDRVAVLRIVYDLFGTKVKGWDEVDPTKIELHGAVIHRDRDAAGNIIKVPKKVKEPKVKQEATAKVTKMVIEAKRKGAKNLKATAPGAAAALDASADAEEAKIEAVVD